MGDQAIEQSTYTAAEQPQETPEQAPEQEPEQAQAETQGEEGTASTEDNAFDYSKLGSMSQQEQLAALSKAGIFGDGEKPANKPQDTPQQTETPEQENNAGQGTDQPAKGNEPEFEVVVDGQKVKVKQSELLAGYQRQADYTRKTQELAEQRRQADAMIAALKVQQQTQAPTKDKPENTVQSEYEQAVAQAEKELGIKPGDFNQFDAAHNFALQKVIAQGNAQKAERESVNREIAEFVSQAQKDPLTQKIDQNFNVYLFKIAQESPEQANRAMQIMQASNRLQNKQATKADTKLLKEHWEYVRKALSTPATPPAPAAPPKPEPPKTETPGQVQAQHSTFDPHKLRGMNTTQQIAALKKAGFFG